MSEVKRITSKCTVLNVNVFTTVLLCTDFQRLYT